MHYGHTPSPCPQTLDGEAHAILRHHPKDNKLGVPSKSLHETIRVPTLKDIQRLLFQQDLLVAGEVLRKPRARIIRHPHNFFRQRLGDKLRPGGSFYAMRWKDLEFGIVRRMKTPMGNQEYAPLPRRIGEPPDVGQQLLRARHIQIPSRQHEISLHIHFPENKLSRNHGSASRPDPDECSAGALPAVARACPEPVKGPLALALEGRA